MLPSLSLSLQRSLPYPADHCIMGESCSVVSMDCTGLFATTWTVQGPRAEYWSGYPFPSSGDLPNPGIKPRSPTLQVDCLPAEPQGELKNTGEGSLSLLQQIFPTQESNLGLMHCRQILYPLSYLLHHILPGCKETPPAPLRVGAPPPAPGWHCSLFSSYTVFTPLLVSSFVLSTPQSFFFSPTFKKMHDFIFHFWLCWLFGAAWAFAVVSGATLCLQCTGSLFRSTGSAVVGRALNCSAACAVFPDQGWNPCILPWQVDSLSLSHQGSPDTPRS